MHIQKKQKTNITIRIDEDLKEKLETACDYLGLTVTAVFHQSARRTLDEYYKRRAEDTRIARLISEGDNAQFMFDAAKREVLGLQLMGFDNLLDANLSIDTVRFQMYYEFIYQQVCKDLDLPFDPLPKRINRATAT